MFPFFFSFLFLFCFVLFFFFRESNYCKLTVLGCSVIATSKRQIFVSGLDKSSLNSESLRLYCVITAESMQHEFWTEVQPERPSCCFKQKEG